MMEHCRQKVAPERPLRSGRCRIRTRVVGFEARQDIQATLIARNPSEMATLLE